MNYDLLKETLYNDLIAEKNKLIPMLGTLNALFKIKKFHGGIKNHIKKTKDKLGEIQLDMLEIENDFKGYSKLTSAQIKVLNTNLLDYQKYSGRLPDIVVDLKKIDNFLTTKKQIFLKKQERLEIKKWLLSIKSQFSELDKSLKSLNFTSSTFD